MTRDELLQRERKLCDELREIRRGKVIAWIIVVAAGVAIGFLLAGIAVELGLL
jgi:hypothetical protein